MGDEEMKTRGTVMAAASIVLGVFGVAVTILPLLAMGFSGDDCIRSVVAVIATPLAVVAGVLALGAGYLCAAAWRSPHAVAGFVLFLLTVAGAVAIVVTAGSIGGGACSASQIFG